MLTLFPRRNTDPLIAINNAAQLFPCEESKLTAEVNFSLIFFQM